MDDYDYCSRYAVKTDPAGFVAWLFGPGVPVTFAGWLDSRTLPPTSDGPRTADSVAKLKLASRSDWLALVTEFQTKNDPEILERMLEYLALFRRQLRRDGAAVVGALVNLTGPPQSGVLAMELPGTDVGRRLSMCVRTMRNEDARVTLTAIAAGTVARSLLSWIPLMRGGNDLDTIQQWLALANREPDRTVRGRYGFVAKMFAQLKQHEATWEAALKGWDMRIPYFEEIRAEERVATKQADLLRGLQLRFERTVPRPVAATIRRTTDLELLDRWFAAIFSSATLADFRAAMNT